MSSIKSHQFSRNVWQNSAVGAAGLDVYTQEPTPNHDLYSHPRVSCTPHIGAQTDEAQQKVGAEVAQLISDFFRN